MELSDIKNEFLKEFYQIDNAEIILNLKNYLKNLKKKEALKSEWQKYAGIWSEEEADEISKIIKDCENIDFKEW